MSKMSLEAYSRVQSRRVGQWSEAVQKQLYNLNLGINGNMRGMTQDKKMLTAAIFLKGTQLVVGWCCIYHHIYHRNNFDVYVNPRHRRKGIATHLLNYMKRKRVCRVAVHPHDNRSQGFYGSHLEKKTVR